MSDNESHEETLVNLFDFKVGNSVGQSRSSRNPYFHFVFGEEHDKNINFSKPANIELDENEETINIYFGGDSENEPSHLLSGQRFKDNADEMDDEDAEKNYLLIFDEATKTYTLECLDYEFHIGNDFSDVNGAIQKPETSYSDAELERELESQLQKGIEEEYQSRTLNGEYFPDDCIDEEEDDGFEEKFREIMEIEGKGKNGITNDEYEDEDDGDDAWMEDDRLEEVDAPSPQAPSPVAEDDMYGPIEDESLTKDDISGSSNSSSSGATSSSSSDSDNSGDGSDSTDSELSDLGDFEAQMKQSMSVTKSPHTKKNSNTVSGNPISLAALLGGGAEEQDQDGSSDDSD